MMKFVHIAEDLTLSVFVARIAGDYSNGDA
jgi:hypothetical protein